MLSSPTTPCEAEGGDHSAGSTTDGEYPIMTHLLPLNDPPTLLHVPLCNLPLWRVARQPPPKKKSLRVSSKRMHAHHPPQNGTLLRLASAAIIPGGSSGYCISILPHPEILCRDLQKQCIVPCNLCISWYSCLSATCCQPRMREPFAVSWTAGPRLRRCYTLSRSTRGAI